MFADEAEVQEGHIVIWLILCGVIGLLLTRSAHRVPSSVSTQG